MPHPFAPRSPGRHRAPIVNESNVEGRSDDKGPEPEGVAVGQVGGRTYAFVGFERVGGIAVFDITDPKASRFVTYVNNRDFSVSGTTTLFEISAVTGG